MTTLLDFYRQHGISPVRQDISDLPAHFARRAALYRSLGIWPLSVMGKHVLEVGPGSGDNARYTASLDPERYVVLEPNHQGAEDIRARAPVGIEVIEMRVEESDWDGCVDLVLCEGLLGLCGSNPNALLEHVARHVAVGGVLVITCIDAISDHAEVLRRAMAQRLLHERLSQNCDIADQVAVLRPVFAPHLATLKGMTRSVDDWIIDNLLNPASIGPTFSIPDACEAIEGRLEVLGCSPRFLMDWRWYKEQQAGNAWAIESYWQQAHNLYDYRRIEPPKTKAENQALMMLCLLEREKQRGYEQGWQVEAPEPLTDIGWFGRGQQYLSFVRTA